MTHDLPNQSVTIESLKQSILRYARYSMGKEWESLSDRERFVTTSLAVRESMIEMMLRTERTAFEQGKKRIYYLSMEFLAGRALGNNLLNLGIREQCARALEEIGADLDELEEQEPDPALGNGGLGRLAACFVDSMATLGYAGYGYGINYEYGLFRQEFRDGSQVERPDVWRDPGTPWLIRRPDRAHRIPVFGRTTDHATTNGRTTSNWVDTREIIGVPSDMPVVGYGGRTVNYLRLYAARASEEFDVKIFNAGDYVRALEDKIRSERISKVLYPSDDIPAGRELRLLQEYFFVACALRDVMNRHGGSRDELLCLDQKAAIQLNDTHPALAVAELMRLLVDEKGLGWDEALELTRRTVSYTNHTLMPEAQERWPVALLERVVPRHLEIIRDLNAGFLDEVEERWPGDGGRRESLSVIEQGDSPQVRMMNLSIVGSHVVNGVSAMHSELVRTRLVPDFHALWPEKFQNKTNGVTQRRWLLSANPELAALLTRHLGDRWIKDLFALDGLMEKLDDSDLGRDLRAVKQANKVRLAAVIRRTLDLDVDPESLFDVQVKRIHEYKRQLLNALRIVHDYICLVDDDRPPEVPRTYVFGGKAAPGYVRAKQIIKLINSIAKVINQDPRAADWMRVAFIPDYRVTLAERIIPAADLSEQISTAGMEASGTGNMKFMMNGALTVGTLDGANVEMIEEAGAENFYLFGLTADEIDTIRREQSYDPRALFEQDPTISRILTSLVEGRFPAGQSKLFREIVDSLLSTDPYFILRDLPAFLEIQQQIGAEYQQSEVWNRKCLINIARSGKFSSDRTIREYAREIWGLK